MSSEPSLQCKACQTRGKVWNGADPKCSFAGEAFNGDGWNCATANLIRDLCEKEGDLRIHHLCVEDQHYATINTVDFNVLPVKDEKGYLRAQPVCLWVGWYKQRGRTEAMWLMFDASPPRCPTEEECLKILEYYKMGQG